LTVFVVVESRQTVDKVLTALLTGQLRSKNIGVFGLRQLTSNLVVESSIPSPLTIFAAAGTQNRRKFVRRSARVIAD
jgi:hypothetical protein